jgi:hypothetical protein
MFFVGFITFAIPPSGGEDPLVKKDEAAIAEVTNWIIRQLGEVTEHGRKTAPAISTLLETLNSSLGPPYSDPYDVWATKGKEQKIKRKEIRRLKALYGNWEPIYKWQGEDGDSEATGQ